MQPPTLEPIELVNPHLSGMKGGAILTPSAREPGRWQATYFDVSGFSGDTTHDTHADALEDLDRQGYIIATEPLLEVLAQTVAFQKGNERSCLVRMINERTQAGDGAAHQILVAAFEERGLEYAEAVYHERCIRKEYGFKRVKCACRRCQINCEYMPGYLVPEDVERIMKHLGYDDPIAFARDNLRFSEDTIVKKGSTTYAIGTLVPRRQKGGSCKFLTPEGRCGIHEVSPFGCAFFGGKMSKDEEDQRAEVSLARIAHAHQRETYSSLYVRLFTYLKSQGLRARFAQGHDGYRRELSAAINRERLGLCEQQTED